PSAGPACPRRAGRASRDARRSRSWPISTGHGGTARPCGDLSRIRPLAAYRWPSPVSAAVTRGNDPSEIPLIGRMRHLALAKPKIPGNDNRCHPRPISGRPHESRPRARPSVRVWREESNPPRMTTDVGAARSAAVSPGMGEESQGIGGGVRLTRRSRRRPTYLSWPTFAAMLLLVPAAVIGLGLLVGEVNRLVPL